MHRYYNVFSRFILLSHLLFVAPAAWAVNTDPVEAQWSGKVYGPDGPWNAVEVLVSNDQKIALYPGGEWATVLIPDEYCTYNASDGCPATKAGLYDKHKAQEELTGSYGGIGYKPPPEYMKGLPIKSEDGLTSWVDYVDFQEGSGPIPNVSIALLNKVFASYPNDQLYPLSVGCLGLGGPGEVNQTFVTGTTAPNINASLVSGNLFERHRTESNSFGMHIGSAGTPSVKGALHFGGYDQNRVLGKILTSPDGYYKPLRLKDIAIKVVDGASPWSFGLTQDGLLAQGNASIGPQGISTMVDGCSPYLTLPRSTCDALAGHLPVTYDAGLGLYMWNTNDAKYSQIVSSASALEFTFLGSSNTDLVPISVPFRHLNLTLDKPLVQNPQPYFPCFTGSSNFTLGRAFLQDAFVGANWGTKTWFMAQAPGPIVPEAKVVKFSSSDARSIDASNNDWKESWSGYWTALTPAQASGSSAVAPPKDTANPNNTNNTNSKNTDENKSGLSTGAKAGIGVGAGVGGLALIAASAFFFLRSRRQPEKKASAESVNPTNASNNAPSQGYYKPEDSGPSNPSAHESTAYSGSDAHFSQYAPQAYAPSELPGSGFTTAPSELSQSPITSKGPRSPLALGTELQESHGA
ncbi:hypothetical protein PG984_007631 [Apiospora sp. TS-2023a]